jgi:hypothetical protein
MLKEFFIVKNLKNLIPIVTLRLVILNYFTLLASVGTSKTLKNALRLTKKGFTKAFSRRNFLAIGETKINDDKRNGN